MGDSEIEFSNRLSDESGAWLTPPCVSIAVVPGVRSKEFDQRHISWPPPPPIPPILWGNIRNRKCHVLRFDRRQREHFIHSLCLPRDSGSNELQGCWHNWNYGCSWFPSNDALNWKNFFMFCLVIINTYLISVSWGVVVPTWHFDNVT